MSNYPTSIDTFRTIDNIPGQTYDEEKTTTVYAEDLEQRSDAIIAIEETLGEEPQGDYDTVEQRLAALEANYNGKLIASTANGAGIAIENSTFADLITPISENLAVGDLYDIEAAFFILNNSGGSRNYNFRIYTGIRFVEQNISTSQAASSSSGRFFTVKGSLSCISTSLFVMHMSVIAFGNGARNATVTLLTTQGGARSNIVSADMTGAKDIKLVLNSTADTTIQTCYLEYARIIKRRTI